MLAHLAAHRFRNLRNVQWRPGAGSHLLLGSNGAGKTSLLEAVHLVATTRSFRTPRFEDCAAREALAAPGPYGFDVRAEVVGPARVELYLGWEDGSGLERTLNGRPVSLVEYLGALPVVIWTAREDDILAGIPERRRRLIDAGLVAERPSRIAVLRRYRRTLAQKRELLRRGQEGLEEWNRLLARAAADLGRHRRDWLVRLQECLDACMAKAAPTFPRVRLRYEPSPEEVATGTEAILERLREAESEERRQRRPVLGPHLDRLDILWGDVDVSRVASAGERKALGLLLVSAQAALLESAGRPGIVLADDIDAELDLEVLGSVWGVLSQGRQVLATSNREEIRDCLGGATVWALDDGAIDRERHD